MPTLRFAVYNVEWMTNLFFPDGSPKTSENVKKGKDRKQARRSQRLASIVKKIDADILCIAEGPGSHKGRKTNAADQLRAWLELHGLAGEYSSMNGFSSRGRQELCAIYKKDKVQCVHRPEEEKDPGKKTERTPFNKDFAVKTSDRLTTEVHNHYRPPLEISVRRRDEEGTELMRIILAHTKSKGVFESVDFARFEQLSDFNKRKLYAECYSIRKRCDEWFDDDPDLRLVVAGDINDGFGLDRYEQRFARSAVETLLGDVWDPDKILRHVLPRPSLDRYGWSPSSSRYEDMITGKKVNVLIDHILASESVTYHNAMVWNPFQEKESPDVQEIRKALKKVSDHFPLSVDIVLPEVGSESGSAAI